MKNKNLQPINEYKTKQSTVLRTRGTKFEILNRTGDDDSLSKKSIFKADASLTNHLRNISKIQNRQSLTPLEKKLVKGISTNILKIPDKAKSTHSNESSEKLGDQRVTLKEMIENASIDQKLFSLIEDTYELIYEKSVERKKTEQGRYELIDKNLLESLKSTNEDLKIETNKLTEDYNEITKKIKKLNTELNVSNVTMNRNEKYKSDYVNKTYQLEENYILLLLENHKLNEMANKEIIEKDNIFRALVTLTNKKKNRLAKELREVFNKLNNDNFKNPFQIDKTSKIEVLRDKIKVLENEFNEKKKEVEIKKETVRQIMENQI